jgi:hypothetical protein
MTLLKHVVLLLALLVPAGCAIVGATLGKVAGSPPVPAQFEPAKVSTLVLAENFRQLATSHDDADRIARRVGALLSENEVGPIVPADQVTTLRDRMSADFRKMNVIEVARELQAEQVIYIDLQGVGVGVMPGSDVLRGEATASVRVIDVATGSILFPAGVQEGAGVSFESPIRRQSAGGNRAGVRGEALDGLSTNIARLFHPWQADEIGKLAEPD